MADSRAPSRLVTAGFGAGALGAHLSAGTIPLLFLFYLTEFAKVPPALAGVLLAVPKIADLLLDPWIGRRTDDLARRMGSRGALLGLGSIVLPVLTLLLFAPVAGLPLPLRVGVLGVLLVAMSLLSTVYTVAHTALASEIAGDMGGRSTLMSARAIGQTLSGLLASMLAPLLVSAFSDFHGGYLGMSAVLGLMSVVAMGLCWGAVRRVPLRTGVEGETRPPLLKALRQTLSNKDFYCIALVLVLMGAASSALFSALPYANKHLLRAGPENLSLLLTPMFVALLVGVSLSPWLTKRLRPAMLLGWALLVALAGVLWFAIGPRGNASLVTGGLVFGLACGVLTVLISTLAIEACTRSSAHGESLGLYLGILFSAEKLGQSLGGIVVGVGLEWVGSLEVPAGSPALQRLELLWVGVPALALTIALLPLIPLHARLRAL